MSVKSRLRALAYRSLVPTELRHNWRYLTSDRRLALSAALQSRYFSQPLNHFGGTVDEYLSSPEGVQDMVDHVDGRLNYAREWVMPWLNAARPLKGAHVLDLGCGTGASTVALAEQGAIVTAVDVNEGNLAAARERCAIYELPASFLCANATELHTKFAGVHFDFIIFFASVEHLTIAERLSAMKSTWAMLAPGELWCVVEAPNRLSPIDDHTTCLPFGHWIPDELLLDYAGRSERAFMQAYPSAPRDDATRMDLARRGRGISYHEFDLAFGQNLDVVSSRNSYVRSINVASRLKWLYSVDRKAAKFLRSQGPAIHEGFYERYLDLIVRKGATR